MTVDAPFSVLTAAALWLKILPPARFSIVAEKLEPAVFENTASESVPVAVIVPVLTSESLLP